MKRKAKRVVSAGMMSVLVSVFAMAWVVDYRLWYPCGFASLALARMFPDLPAPAVETIDASKVNRKPGWLLEVLADYKYRGVPVVIRGAAKDWPAVAKWTPRYIAEEVGDGMPVTLQTGIQEQEKNPFVMTSMGAFATWLERHPDTPTVEAYNRRLRPRISSPYYMAEEFDFIDSFPGLLEDMRGLEAFVAGGVSPDGRGGLVQPGGKQTGTGNYKNYGGEEEDDDDDEFHYEDEDGEYERQRDEAGSGQRNKSDVVVERLETAFWMGASGARSGWHYDADYGLNALVQIVGTKNMTIAAPSQTQRLYPSSRFDPGAVLSSINFWDPPRSSSSTRRRGRKAAEEEPDYPLYADLKTQTLEVRPGDVAMIPAGWWHAVEGHGFTTSVSVRRMDRIEYAINAIDRVKEFLHEAGLYASQDDCVCHAPTIERPDLVHPRERENYHHRPSKNF
eukprot:g3733.t1